ncbi:hypothetical protein GA0115259_1028411 [Streptomyces sp. MnatMP-M17]|nr:hypothetical protein GA0115259_1028411 [Streptomyces sp. MnatMP-M17]
MSERQTCPSAPVVLPLRLDAEPKPVPGCAHCDNIAMEHDRARANGEASKRRDCNVRLRRHLSADHR